MICDTTIVQVSGTVIVGILILVSLRQSMGLTSVGTFFVGIVVSVITPFILAAIVAIIGYTLIANFMLAIGFLALLSFLLGFAAEAKRKENRVR